MVKSTAVTKPPNGKPATSLGFLGRGNTKSSGPKVKVERNITAPGGAVARTTVIKKAPPKPKAKAPPGEANAATQPWVNARIKASEEETVAKLHTMIEESSQGLDMLIERGVETAVADRMSEGALYRLLHHRFEELKELFEARLNEQAPEIVAAVLSHMEEKQQDGDFVPTSNSQRRMSVDESGAGAEETCEEPASQEAEDIPVPLSDGEQDNEESVPMLEEEVAAP